MGRLQDDLFIKNLVMFGVAARIRSEDVTVKHGKLGCRSKTTQWINWY